MRWKKHGLIFDASVLPDWASNSALTPTPLLLNDRVVRVYAGFRDSAGTSRIGYVDLDVNNPSRVLNVSEQPALDIGRDGCFDDNGVILGHVMRTDDEIRMYYVGFQLVRKAKFLAFTGLATSKDGERFERIRDVPVLGRRRGASMINAIHSLRRDGNGWQAWAAQGDGWELRHGKPYPKYDIWQLTSPDGIYFSEVAEKRNVVLTQGDEYRVGRPSAFEGPDGRGYMFYTAGYRSTDGYNAGLAVTDDWQTWRRSDDLIGLNLSPDGFDSLHLCYPRIFCSAGKYWVVYNGNDMGQRGFGLAELIEW